MGSLENIESSDDTKQDLVDCYEAVTQFCWNFDYEGSVDKVESLYKRAKKINGMQMIWIGIRSSIRLSQLSQGAIRNIHTCRFLNAYLKLSKKHLRLTPQHKCSANSYMESKVRP